MQRIGHCFDSVQAAQTSKVLLDVASGAQVAKPECRNCQDDGVQFKCRVYPLSKQANQYADQ
jgi:hypothetical protein